MKTSRLCGALLTVMLPFAVAGTANASTPPKETVLMLTIATPEGEAQSVALTCGPAGGTHPSPRAACRELRAVNGDFGSLPAHHDPVACTMEYRPQIAKAKGVWRGERVRWEQEYSNRCTLQVGTGKVFAF